MSIDDFGIIVIVVAILGGALRAYFSHDRKHDHKKKSCHTLNPV
jgi:hypothetical protein